MAIKLCLVEKYHWILSTICLKFRCKELYNFGDVFYFKELSINMQILQLKSSS